LSKERTKKVFFATSSLQPRLASSTKKTPPSREQKWAAREK
jgi:hypothetical protein